MATADDAFTYIRDLLNQYDLGELGDWAWQQLVEGRSEVQVVQSMRDQPAFQIRFAGLEIRRQKNLPAMTPAEYISYERQARQILRDSGMPEGFWDQPSDFAQLIGNDKSINELNQQITGAYVRVSKAPPEVRDAFTSFFGAAGDTALAAFFLDPERTSPMLDRVVTEAEIAGTGTRFGVGVSQGTAERLAQLGVNLQSAGQGFAQIGELGQLFSETITESQDLTASREGVGAVFGADTTSGELVRKRKAERAAKFGGTSQQAALGQEGLAGIGSSNY